MSTVLHWPEIERALQGIDLVAVMAEAFIAYSAGRAVIPPVGELQFDDPPGDVHIKYGTLLGGAHYVVKIASGFYNNPALGLSSSQGLMLLFSSNTGQLEAVLLDEGHLTDRRTAAAGALTVQQLAPSTVNRIGIVGTGIQAKEQLKAVASVHPCRSLSVWGRTAAHVRDYHAFAEQLGFTVYPTDALEALVRSSQIIVTTTPATRPLIQSHWVQPGTHITAVGADTPTKQELDAALLARADCIVSDSRSQALTRGEVYQALQHQHIQLADVIELGELLTSPSLGRKQDADITVADLTGVAVQDLAIATCVLQTMQGMT